MSETLTGRYYQLIRGTAEAMNNRKPANHPCARGNGECCGQGDITVTLEDAKIIAAAVGSGRISRAVKQQVISNAADPSRTYCPFFDTDRRVCAIYRYRPLVCIAYSMGGIPKSSGVMADVPMGELQFLNMCQGCFNKLDGSMKTVPLQDVQDFRVIRGYLQQVPMMTMRDFARGILPGRRSF